MLHIIIVTFIEIQWDKIYLEIKFILKENLFHFLSSHPNIQTRNTPNVHIRNTQYTHQEYSVYTPGTPNIHIKNTQYTHQQHSVYSSGTPNIHTRKTQHTHQEHPIYTLGTPLASAVFPTPVYLLQEQESWGNSRGDHPLCLPPVRHTQSADKACSLPSSYITCSGIIFHFSLKELIVP